LADRCDALRGIGQICLAAGQSTDMKIEVERSVTQHGKVDGESGLQIRPNIFPEDALSNDADNDITTEIEHRRAAHAFVDFLTPELDRVMAPVFAFIGIAGTENVAAIAGFGVAATAARHYLEEAGRIGDLRARLEAGIKAVAPDAVIFGAAAERLANTMLFAVPGVNAETAVIAFDLEGVAVSSGSACSSGKVGDSHVLAAMGVSPDLHRGGIRMSLAPSATATETEYVVDAWRRIYARLSERRAA